MELKLPRSMKGVMTVQIKWCQAVEIIGGSPRAIRRSLRRYEAYGYDGLYDRRMKRPPRKRRSRRLDPALRKGVKSCQGRKQGFGQD